MSRLAITLSCEAERKRAHDLIDKALPASRIEFKGPRRTVDQNAKLWACLGDVSTQKEHCGRKYEPEVWKVIFMSALGREMKFVPALDGQGLIPLGHSSADLSVGEMSELIEFVLAWGTQSGVVFHEPT